MFDADKSVPKTLAPPPAAMKSAADWRALKKTHDMFYGAAEVLSGFRSNSMLSEADYDAAIKAAAELEIRLWPSRT